jgi:hypothetical protein
MAADGVSGDHGQGRRRARHENQRNPPSELNEHQCHGRQGESTLHESAEVLDQGDRPFVGVGAGAVEPIVILGQLELGEVSGDCLLVDQPADMVPHAIGLCSPHETASGSEGLSEEDEARHQPTWKKDPAKHLPRSPGPCNQRQPIDDDPRQVNQRDRQQTLADDEKQPCGGPSWGRVPHQPQGAREKR